MPVEQDLITEMTGYQAGEIGNSDLDKCCVREMLEVADVTV